MMEISLRSLIFDSVFDSIFDSGSSNSTSIHQFYYLASTQLRSPTFSICLYDESRGGTPVCRYLDRTDVRLEIEKIILLCLVNIKDMK